MCLGVLTNATVLGVDYFFYFFPTDLFLIIQFLSSVTCFREIISSLGASYIQFTSSWKLFYFSYMLKLLYLLSYSKSPFLLTHGPIHLLVSSSSTQLSMSSNPFLFMSQYRTLGPCQLILFSCQVSNFFHLTFP